jgi:hypothetical protein
VITRLLLPILISSVALFFASFLSWMVLPFHRADWRKLGREDDLMNAVRDLNIPPGSYMFPGCDTMSEMKSPEYEKKYEAGPRGVMTVFGPVSMGLNLGLTFLYFLVVSFLLAYLGTIGLEAGAEFKDVFRLISTAAFMTFLAAIVQHAIWFKARIVGHVIESIAYALITGAIFAALWPAGTTE